MEYTGETYKCKSCYHIWAYEDDACPNCGDGNFNEIDIKLSMENNCDHQWVYNYHQGTKYCSKACNGFREFKIDFMETPKQFLERTIYPDKLMLAAMEKKKLTGNYSEDMPQHIEFKRRKIEIFEEAINKLN